MEEYEDIQDEINAETDAEAQYEDMLDSNAAADRHAQEEQDADIKKTCTLCGKKCSQYHMVGELCDECYLRRTNRAVAP